MKKTLLFAFLFGCLYGQAQDFWTPKATTFSQLSRGVDNISIVDDNVIWAKAYDGASDTPGNVRQYTKSIDGGNTWTSGNINMGVGQSNLNASSISGMSSSIAWATAYPTASSVNGGVWKTVDGGTTWTKQTTALFNTSDSFTNFVYFWDENNGVVQGDPANSYFEIYTTTNGGTTWTRVPSANIPATLSGEYGYVHNYDVVGDTIWFGTNKGRFFKSTNKGLNWTVVQSPISDFAGTASSGSYSFSDANNGLLYASPGVLYKTTDGGTTWISQTYTGMIGNRNIECIPGTTNVVSVGTTPNSSTSYTAYSTDFGLTWTQVMTGTQVTALKFKDNTLGFGGGFTTSSTAGGIYKYSGTELSTADFVDSQNLTVYPNPTSNLLTVSSKNISEVIVYDLTGKQVMHKKANVNDSFTLDVSSLSAGMYLLNAFDATGANSTLKFSKL